VSGGDVQPILEQVQPSCRPVQAAGSLIRGLTLTPGSDPEPASSFLRGASSRRSGHPVCGPWRSAARNWRWPRLSCEAQKARTPGRPVRAELGDAMFLARSDSAFFIACRVAFACARAQSAAPPHRWWLCQDDRKWLELRDRPQNNNLHSSKPGMSFSGVEGGCLNSLKPYARPNIVSATMSWAERARSRRRDATTQHQCAASMPCSCFRQVLGE
jgi:hypothetical protein